MAGHPGWSVYVGEHSRLETDLSWLDGWRGDGAIARIENEAIARYVRKAAVPVVNMSATGFELAPEFPCVETDDDTIAQWAAEHFAERGLRNFAFCNDPRFRWSTKRAYYFAQHARQLGHNVHEFSINISGTAARRRLRLVKWLQDLPKPVGVFACYDIAGQEVLEACIIADLPVPDAVAVLGVDNDELICNLTSPPLSSIQPDTARTGHLAAQLLDEIMSGRQVDRTMHLVRPLRLVSRLSSDIYSVDDQIVARALRYIYDHADENLSVADVQRNVSLSRRALDYRFAGFLGRTVHEEILRVRMDRVAEMLIRTDLTLPQIAERLGFPHAEYMGVAFRHYTGKSPGEYRRANRANIHG